MASTNLLNLTLDEIIQRTRKGEKNQVANPMGMRRKGRNMAVGGQNKNINFQKRSNLSHSLSSRLSSGAPGTGGFKNANKFRRRNLSVQSRLGVAPVPEAKRTSVYNRLTLSTNRPTLYSSTALTDKPLQRNRGLKTKNAEESLPVRITNGAIVKGLRSDQLLLQKLNQHRNRSLQAKVEKLRSIQMRRSQVRDRSLRRGDPLSSTSKVLLDMDHGLTVRIRNEVFTRPKPLERPKRPVVLTTSSSSSEDDDDDYPLSRERRRHPQPQEDPDTSKRYPPTAPSLLRLGVERPPPPKPHRQILDDQIQKEIAALQGFVQPHTGGPGPGIKGFKMVPNRTKHSLNDRFTLEKTETVD